MPKDRVNILDVEVSKYDLKETMRLFTEAIESGNRLRVSVTPVNCILWAHRDEKLRQIYNSADLTTADGVPLLWASKFLGSPIRGRVTGLDLLPEFSKISAEKRFRYFFFGCGRWGGVEIGKSFERDEPRSEYSGFIFTTICR